MYSAAPSALTEQILDVPGQHAARNGTGLERGFDEMSLTSRGQNGAHAYGDEYDPALLDEFREEEVPLGYGIEHACRWVAGSWGAGS